MSKIELRIKEDLSEVPTNELIEAYNEQEATLGDSNDEEKEKIIYDISIIEKELSKRFNELESEGISRLLNKSNFEIEDWLTDKETNEYRKLKELMYT